MSPPSFHLPVALACFFLSGFASLIYQTTWLRQTMSLFGCATPTVASMLAIFMGGLTLGSYFSGRWVRKCEGRPALFYYALIEGVIGLGGVLAGPVMDWFRHTGLWLHAPGVTVRWAITFGFLAVSLLPWTFAMGATYPFFLRGTRGGRLSFGWLYAANVGGAMTGTLLAGFILFEYVGFRRSQWVGVEANTVAVLLALALAYFLPSPDLPSEAEKEEPVPAPSADRKELVGATLVIGAVSLGFEVIWTRLYTPVLGTVVYAFSGMLAVYLGATWTGSLFQRWAEKRGMAASAIHRWIGLLTAASAVCPHLATAGFPIPKIWALVLGVGPFCLLTGFWTPLLVEQYAAGKSERVGFIYAWNGLGCLIGPLLAGFLLLPVLGARFSLLTLTLLLVVPAWLTMTGDKIRAFLPLLVAIPVFSLVPSFEERIGSRLILHDATATVAAVGRGMDRHLLVNGVGMTRLVNETKWMVHLPALVHGNPKKILVICFGMGTSYRSALAWDAEVTAVELVPSVIKVFPYYHSDAEAVLSNPRGRIVVDDGRHFLETTPERYDLIVVDPPPPVESAGSALLNSREFFAAARHALRPGGILLQWTPGGDLPTKLSMMTTLAHQFPHLTAFYAPGWIRGIYLLASESPLRNMDPAKGLKDLQSRARSDLEEWMQPGQSAIQLTAILERKISRSEILEWTPAACVLTDDFPVNEYYWMRNEGFFWRRGPRWLPPPPTEARMLLFLMQRSGDLEKSGYTGDPDFIRYQMASTFHDEELARRCLEAVRSRYPQEPALQTLVDEAQERLKKIQGTRFNR